MREPSAKQPGENRIVGLVDDAEAGFLRKAAALLGWPATVVHTRRDFEALSGGYEVLVVGDDQSRSERLSTVRRARKRHGESVIAAIAEDLEMQVDLIEAGASYVVSLSDPPRRFADGIRAARERSCPLDPEVVAAVVQRLQHLARLCVDQGVDVARCEQLTGREREIVALLASRRSNGEIARELGIAVGTVKTHVHNILDKLDVEDRGLAGVYWRVFDEKRGLRR